MVVKENISEKLNFIGDHVSRQLKVIQFMISTGQIPFDALDLLFEMLSEIAEVDEDGKKPFVETWNHLKKMRDAKPPRLTPMKWAKRSYGLALRELNNQQILARKIAWEQQEKSVWENYGYGKSGG